MCGCSTLGFMYDNGNGVEKNEQKAAELFKKSL
ncbi:MAG: SEL1-like repeat protein [Campylobacter lanienae]|nr:SEL1-like repeat protein [Campylobacteraceae bacterium]MDY2818195.1 SEL1-like repeat protein [Campylobacter lanienae]